MSTLTDRVMNMTPRQIEDADWMVAANSLIEAKKRFAELGFGNQSWLDGAIGIASERAKLGGKRDNKIGDFEYSELNVSQLKVRQKLSSEILLSCQDSSESR